MIEKGKKKKKKRKMLVKYFVGRTQPGRIRKIEPKYVEDY